MKHSHLRGIAHSLADSLASGVSVLTGFHDLRLYEDAARSEGGELTIDLLNGTVVSGTPSPALAAALARVPEQFDRLGRAQGIGRGDCRVARATFRAHPLAPGFTLVVQDRSGRMTEADYQGCPARRVTEVDAQGRRRKRPIRRRQ